MVARPIKVSSVLLGETVENIDELVQAARAFSFPLLDPLGHASFNVAPQDGKTDPVECGFRRGELLKDLDTQARLFDHPPNAAHLTFDTVQSGDERLLLGRVQHVE